MAIDNVIHRIEFGVKKYEAKYAEVTPLPFRASSTQKASTDKLVSEITL